jgi:hypothetical protein
MNNQEVLSKIEMLKCSVREVQKYELMTTNQYRKQVAFIIEILEDLAKMIRTHSIDQMRAPPQTTINNTEKLWPADDGLICYRSSHKHGIPLEMP